MIRTHDYFKLGTYIIVGTFMITAVIIILGAGQYFQTSYTLETYFDESINGLSVGSPVKLRGVEIGRVGEIDFVSNVYAHNGGANSRYVYVICDITPQLFDDVSEKDFEEYMTKSVEQGLRVRPTSLGLTGQLFLNVVYTDPNDTPPLPLKWQPEHTYIPPAPSTMSRIESAITTISKTLASIDKDDIKSIISDVKSIVGAIDKFMKTDGGQEAGDRILSILHETKVMMHRVNELLADPAMARLIPEAAGILTETHDIISASSGDMKAAIKETREAMTSFKEAASVLAKHLSDPRVDKALGEIGPTLENISRSSAQLTAAVTKVHGLVNRLNGIVASEEANVHSILDDTREVMQNVKELTDDAKRYPSGIFFGKPPSQAAPEAE